MKSYQALNSVKRTRGYNIADKKMRIKNRNSGKKEIVFRKWKQICTLLRMPINISFELSFEIIDLVYTWSKFNILEKTIHFLTQF